MRKETETRLRAALKEAGLFLATVRASKVKLTGSVYSSRLDVGAVDALAAEIRALQNLVEDEAEPKT